MTLRELIQAVRDEAHDPYGSRWSDSTITRYLNDAQIDIARDTRRLYGWQYDVEAGTEYVTKPSDLLVPKYVYFDIPNGNRLQLYFTNEYPPADLLGVPQKICVVGNYYYFFPKPNTSGKLILMGVRRPVAMVSDTDVPELEDADSVLVAYAVWQCYLSDGDLMAQVWENHYRQRRGEWLVFDAMRNPVTDVIEREWWD